MDEGFLRLSAGESIIMPDASRIGSAIKRICSAYVEPHGNTYYLPIWKSGTPGHQDTYNKFFLESTFDIDIIDKISLVFSNGANDVIYEISNSAIQVQRLLQPKPANYGMIPLNFPKFEMCRFQYGKPEVIVRSKSLLQITRRINSELKTYLPEALADMVSSFIGTTATISLWARQITIPIREIENIIRDQTPMTFPIAQCQEEVFTILPHGRDIQVISGFAFLLNKLIMVFYRADDPSEEPLAVMNYGSLSRDARTIFEWTGQSAHVFDKAIHDAHIPEKPIYTLTFDNKILNTGNSVQRSRINFSGHEMRLHFDLDPRPYAMTLRIIGESVNKILIADGAGCVRYVKNRCWA
jgi:hypothetical protein